MASNSLKQSEAFCNCLQEFEQSERVCKNLQLTETICESKQHNFALSKSLQKSARFWHDYISVKNSATVSVFHIFFLSGFLCFCFFFICILVFFEDFPVFLWLFLVFLFFPWFSWHSLFSFSFLLCLEIKFFCVQFHTLVFLGYLLIFHVFFFFFLYFLWFFPFVFLSFPWGLFVLPWI